jgi:hypothetical protein
VIIAFFAISICFTRADRTRRASVIIAFFAISISFTRADRTRRASVIIAFFAISICFTRADRTHADAPWRVTRDVYSLRVSRLLFFYRCIITIELYVHTQSPVRVFKRLRNQAELLFHSVDSHSPFAHQNSLIALT